jgi:hypothetical protein
MVADMAGFSLRHTYIDVRRHVHIGISMDGFVTPRQRQAVPAEARGLARVWAQHASRRWSALLATFEGREMVAAAKGFCRGSSSHRTRDWLALRDGFGRYAFLQDVVLQGRHPLATWVAIKASQEPTFFSASRDLTAEEYGQTWFTVCYVIAGRGITRPEFCWMARATWTLSASFHATGRLTERCPGASIDNALIAVHKAIMAAPYSNLRRLSERSFLIPAGNAGFAWCNLTQNYGDQDHRPVWHLKVRSWLSSDMPSEAERHYGISLLTPDGGESLGQTIFMPWHLREY